MKHLSLLLIGLTLLFSTVGSAQTRRSSFFTFDAATCKYQFENNHFFCKGNTLPGVEVRYNYGNAQNNCVQYVDDIQVLKYSASTRRHMRKLGPSSLGAWPRECNELLRLARYCLCRKNGCFQIDTCKWRHQM